MTRLLLLLAATLSSLGGACAAPGSCPPSPDAPVPSEILVRFVASVDVPQRDRILSDVGGIVLKAYSLVPNLFLVQISIDMQEAIRRLQSTPGVLYAHPNHPLLEASCSPRGASGPGRAPSAARSPLLVAWVLVLLVAPPMAAPPQDRAPAVPGEAILKLRSATPSGALVSDLDRVRARPLAPVLVQGLYLVPRDPGGQDSVAELVARYSQEIEYTHPNYYLRPTADVFPSDQLFANQWSLHNDGTALHGSNGTFTPDPLADIDAPRGWAFHRGGVFVVAILDSGIAKTLPGLVFPPDLDANLWRDASGGVGWDLVNGGPVTVDPTINAHGTRIASIIGAIASEATGNGEAADGIAGINWSCRMMPLRIVGPAGRFGQAATVDRVITALDFVAQNRVRLSNNSYGARSISNALGLRDAIRNLGPNHLFVCAAGNEGRDLAEDPFYPASFQLENMLVVTSIDPQGNIPRNRNRGPRDVDLAAPGEQILALASPGYGLDSGTSYATAHVTGAAALFWDRQPQWNALQVKQAILDSVRPLPGLAALVRSGGVLNLGNLMEALP